MLEGYCSEQWRPAVGFEGIYSVSSIGRLRRDICGGNGCSWNARAGRILQPFRRKIGYVAVTMWKDGEKHVRLAHRLVAGAFIPNPDGKPHINHKNGIKHDNSVENLEWCTARENVHHAMDVLGWNPKMGDHPKGERHYKARLTQEQVDSIRVRYLAGSQSQYSMAKEYGVSRKTINSLIKGESWGAAAWRKANLIGDPTQ